MSGQLQAPNEKKDEREIQKEKIIGDKLRFQGILKIIDWLHNK